jgi:hypothetical protein
MIKVKIHSNSFLLAADISKLKVPVIINSNHGNPILHTIPFVMQHERHPSREIIVRGPSTNHNSVNTTETTQKSITNQYLNQPE